MTPYTGVVMQSRRLRPPPHPPHRPPQRLPLHSLPAKLLLPTSGDCLSHMPKRHHTKALEYISIPYHEKLWRGSLLNPCFLKGLHLLWTKVMFHDADLCQQDVILASGLLILMLCLQAPAAGAVTSQSVPSPVPAPAAQPPAQPPAQSPSPVRPMLCLAPTVLALCTPKSLSPSVHSANCYVAQVLCL